MRHSNPFGLAACAATIFLVHGSPAAQVPLDAMVVGAFGGGAPAFFFVPPSGVGVPIAFPAPFVPPMNPNAYCIDDVTGDIVMVGTDSMVYRTTVNASGMVTAQVSLGPLPTMFPIRNIADVHQDPTGGIVVCIQHLISRNAPVLYSLLRFGLSPTGTLPSTQTLATFTTNFFDMTDLASDRNGALFLAGAGPPVTFDFNGNPACLPVGSACPLTGLPAGGIDSMAVDLTDVPIFGVRNNPLGNLSRAGTFSTVAGVGGGMPIVQDLHVTANGDLFAGVSGLFEEVVRISGCTSNQTALFVLPPGFIVRSVKVRDRANGNYGFSDDNAPNDGLLPRIIGPGRISPGGGPLSVGLAGTAPGVAATLFVGSTAASGALAPGAGLWVTPTGPGFTVLTSAAGTASISFPVPPNLIGGTFFSQWVVPANGDVTGGLSTTVTATPDPCF